MAVTLHPSLSQKAEEPVREEQEPAPAADVAPEAPVEPVLEPTSEVSVSESNATEALEEAPEPAPDPRKWIDPGRGYYQELMRLEREDLEFRNALRTRAGRMAATEWKPKVANLEAELAELRRQVQEERLKALDPDEIKERLYQDPKFRQEYDRTRAEDPSRIRLQAAIESRINAVIDEAEQYLPPEEIARRHAALQQGAYDAVRDQSGRPVRVLTPEESVQWFERDMRTAIFSHLQQQARASAPAAQAAPPPAPAKEPAEAPAPAKSNPALAKASPDLTAPKAPGGSKGMLYSEYKKLNPAQRMAMYRTAADVEAAFARGDLVKDE